MSFRGLLSPAPRRRPRPPVRIDLEHSAPVWLVRAIGGTLMLVTVAPVIGDWIVPAFAVVLLVTLAHPAVVAGLMVLAAGFLWQDSPDLSTCAALTLALGIAMLVVRLTTSLTVAGRVDGRIILRAGAAFVIIQLVAQALIGLSFAAMSGMPQVPWVAVIVLAGIGVAVVAGARWVARNTE